MKFYEYPIFWIATLIGFSIRCLYAFGNKLPGCLFLRSHEAHILNRDARFIFAFVDGTLVTQGYRVEVVGTLDLSGGLGQSAFSDGSPGYISMPDTASLTRDKNFKTLEANDIRELMSPCPGPVDQNPNRECECGGKLHLRKGFWVCDRCGK